jgi:hypothetical protein
LMPDMNFSSFAFCCFLSGSFSIPSVSFVLGIFFCHTFPALVYFADILELPPHSVVL